jgi:pimeloyl-ACP methyl ester carboxylesterase
MPETIEHREVRANGITFHVASSGSRDGPDVLCLHGFPEGWMSWRELMGLLPEARMFAPDLRGYPGSSRPKDGYDVETLTDDIRALIETLDLEKPILVGHDWGGELAWIFAHRYSDLISHLVIVNGTHPKTLTRAVLTFDDYQTLRIPWVPFFQLPWFPEWLIATGLGRKLLRWSFLVREGTKGAMDRALVDEIVARFQQPPDARWPIDYYRQIVRTVVLPRRRRRLDAIYRTAITVPVTMVWGMKDGALPAKIALKSGKDAGCPVEWRPLEGVGHFVDLEAPDRLAAEVRRLLPSAGS